MLNADTITFHEFAVREPLPLATIQASVLEWLQNRDDVVLLGAQAVNAYVNEPRMSQDIDLLSIRARELAQELQAYLSQQFHIAVRLQEVGEGRGDRLYQVQKSGNRHLVDLRPVEKLPPAQRIEQVLVMSPAELIASKVIAYHQRRGKPKSGTDWRDLAMLFLAFPELKSTDSSVTNCLQNAGVDAEILAVWQQLVAQDIQLADEEDEF